MKINHTASLSLFAAALAMFAACSADTTDETAIPAAADDADRAPATFSLTAVTDDQAAVTRSYTSLGDTQDELFNPGALIDVFISEANADGTTATGTVTTYQQPVVAKTLSDTETLNGIDKPFRKMQFMSNTLKAGTTDRDNPANYETYFPQYWPTSGNGVNVYAWYPRGVAGTDVTSTSHTYTVQEDQSRDVSTSDLMYGHPVPKYIFKSGSYTFQMTPDSTAEHPDGNPVSRPKNQLAVTIPLRFKHKLCKIVVNLYYGVGFWKEGKGYSDKAKFTYSKNDLTDVTRLVRNATTQKLSYSATGTVTGKLEYAQVWLDRVQTKYTLTNLKDGTITTSYDASDRKRVWIFRDNDGDGYGDQPADLFSGYCIIPPQKIDDSHPTNIKVQLWDAQALDVNTGGQDASGTGKKTIYQFAIPAGTEFKEGYKYTYDVTVNSAGLTVDTQITPWTEYFTGTHANEGKVNADN